MRRKKKFIFALSLLPIFLVLQTMLVPHVHFDTNGEIHAHTHLGAQDYSELSSYENLDDDNRTESNDREHSHQELHKSEPQFWRLSGLKTSVFRGCSVPSGNLPVKIRVGYPCDFKANTSGAFHNHILRMRNSIALGEHIKRMLSVRIIS